ncbi:MAG: class I SAM-dependent methyltransferase [Acidaminococcales bacterium]|jgi:tRNA (adenine22-N1)-methyltransferase|nr:class I SAM-dependent methyltransferase [Acidaminococcales bacterium]
MRLADRLKKIAGFVPSGARIADIGADHAYLPLWLLEKGIIDFAVAVDVADGPCRAAAASVAAAGADGRIKVRQGYGLSPLKSGEVDAIVIAGMGGSTIAQILDKGSDLLAGVDSLILQPMTGGGRLRSWLCASGWPLAGEELAAEGRKLYEIIFAQKNPAAKHMVYDHFRLEAGPLLLEAGHPLLKRHVGNIAARYARVCRSMENGRPAARGARYETARAIWAAAEDCLRCL